MVWRTFRRRSTLHHVVKNKQVTVQDPVKKLQMDYMSHKGITRATWASVHTEGQKALLYQ